MRQQACGRRIWTAVWLVAFALGVSATSAAPLPPLERASRIWSHESDVQCGFRKVFTLDTAPASATVLITADNGYELYVNGSIVGSDVGAASDVWQSVGRYDITSRLAKGRNIIGIHGIDLGGVRGVIAAARVEVKGRPAMELVTDETWRVAQEGKAVDYSHPEFVEGAEWHDARVVGPMGMTPWGKVAWSEAGEKSRKKASKARVELAQPGKDFVWPEAVAFLGDDCSVPQRLTDGPFHDIDPAELPDGRIVFTSTRIGTFEEYHQPPSRALFRMNADGRDIHLITATPIFDNEPKVMANGRIAFVRTDNFFDRGKVETHLHSIRPDGTDGLAEFAANVGSDYGVRLRAFGYGSPAPLPDGRLAYISSRGNFIGASGSPEYEQQRVIDRVGSPAVRVYYDVANSTERAYDIAKEIRWLGKQGQICEFHMKENGALLGKGRIDFKKVREAIDDIGYRGPMQIEGVVPPGGKLIESYVANLKYLREVFPKNV